MVAFHFGSFCCLMCGSPEQGVGEKGRRSLEQGVGEKGRRRKYSVKKKEGATENKAENALFEEENALFGERISMLRCSSMDFHVLRYWPKSTPWNATQDSDFLRKITPVSKMRMDCMFSVLACFILICFNCVSADFTALIEDTPVIEALGNTAVLHCRTSTPEQLNEVRWIRIQDGKYSIINLFQGGRDQQRCDLPGYIGRTELVKEGLARGSADLKLFNVSVPDEGTYRCYLQTDYFFDMANLELQVTALGSDPRIDIEKFNDDGIMVVCRSDGWYPVPMLVNKDDGELMIRKENGFYSVEYSRLITENSDRTFTCRLRTPFPNQERETSVYLAGGLFRKSTTTDATIIFSTVISVLLMCLSVMVARFILRTRLSHKQEPSNSPNNEGPGQNFPLVKA